MADFSFFDKFLKDYSDVHHFDLMPNYLTIPSEEIQKYYWPIDGHHNSSGYFFMAKEVMHGLKNDIMTFSKMD